MRPWIWITPLTLAILVTGAVLLAPTWAKRELNSQAEARGLQIEVEDLSLGFFRASIKNLRVRPEGVEGVSARLDRVDLELALSAPRLRSVFVEGGEIQIEGDIESVRQRMDDWRSRRPATETPKNVSKVRRSENVRGLNLTWHGALEEGDTQRIEGLQFDRGPDEQRFGIDLVRLSLGPLSGDIAGAKLTIPGIDLDLTQATLGISEVHLTYTTPPSITAASPAPGSSVDNAQPPAPIQDTNSPQSSTASGLEKRLQADSLRVPRVLSGLKFLRQHLLPRLAPETKVERLWLTYLRDKERLHVGPSHLQMHRRNGDFLASVEPKGDAEGTPLSFNLTLHSENSPDAVSVSLQGGPVSLAALGIQEGAFGLQGVGQTRLAGAAQAHLSQDARQVSGEGQLSLQELTLASSRLAEQLVSFPQLKLKGRGAVDVDGTHYQLENAELTLGETRFEGDFDMKRGEDFVSLKASAKAPLISCQALVDSAPRGLLGAVQDIRFDGTFSLDAEVEADSRELSKMRVHWDFKNGCRALKVPLELDPAKFHGVFRREVLGAGNYPMEMEFGPLSSNWTPYSEISPFLEKALLVTEDGRFFRHNGFDDRAIESAIAQNARAGRFIRGASTISMQLAKNLYLSRDKTLARKLREAALTSLLEQSYDKKEILELYVNVIEFGPGIYGIQKAAEYYFQTTPKELTAAQSFFLASILPSPTVQYFGADRKLSAARTEHIHRLLNISRKRDALTDAQLESALSEGLIFGQKETGSENTQNSEPSSRAPNAVHGAENNGEDLNEGPESNPSGLEPRRKSPRSLPETSLP